MPNGTEEKGRILSKDIHYQNQDLDPRHSEYEGLSTTQIAKKYLKEKRVKNKMEVIKNSGN